LTVQCNYIAACLKCQPDQEFLLSKPGEALMDGL